MHLLFTAVRLNVPACAAVAAVLLLFMGVGTPAVAYPWPKVREGDVRVAGSSQNSVAQGKWLDNPDENDKRWHYTINGIHYARTLTKEEEEVASRYVGYDTSGPGLPPLHLRGQKNKPTMRYKDANGNKGTLWCNPGPCTAGSPLKHGWATGVGTFLPLKLVEDVKKTLGEAVNKEIATFSSATNRKIFNITKDALLAYAETSDDPKLKSAAAMTTEQIKSNQVAFEEQMARGPDVSCNVGPLCGSYESNYLGDKPCITSTCRQYRKWVKERPIMLAVTAEEAILYSRKNGQVLDPSINTQIYVDENGNKGTLWCNPGPCTLGSATKHGWISGAGTLLPEELVGAATKILTTDSETSSSAIRSEIFNITLKTIKEAAETSDDPKLKSAAAMTTEQIKSKQVANEKSQEDKSGNLVVVEEAPVEEAPVEEAPVEEAPVEEAPVEEAPVEEAPVEEAPVEEAPVEEAPVEEAPVEEAPVEEAPVEEAPVEEAPVEEAPVEEAPVEEAPVEEAPVEEAPVEEAPVEEAPVEEAPVEEAPVEEAPVEEAPVEEAPVEEAPVEEAPVEEAPVEEDHHHDDGTEAPVDEGTEAPVEEWDDDCLGMEQCNVPIEG